jgi:hypothetical protein
VTLPIVLWIWSQSAHRKRLYLPTYQTTRRHILEDGTLMPPCERQIFHLVHLLQKLTQLKFVKLWFWRQKFVYIHFTVTLTLTLQVAALSRSACISFSCPRCVHVQSNWIFIHPEYRRSAFLSSYKEKNFKKLIYSDQFRNMHTFYFNSPCTPLWLGALAHGHIIHWMQ